MKTNLSTPFAHRFAVPLFVTLIIAFTGCDLLSTEDESPECNGDFVLIRRLHNSAGSTETISDPYRACYTLGLVEQRNIYTAMGTELEVSNIYIELNGPRLDADGAHHYYHTVTLVSAGKDFFEASLQNITARFTPLDANKLPVAGDKEVAEFEMLKIDPLTRQVSFRITESTMRTGNYTKFVYEPYEIINLPVPENP